MTQKRTTLEILEAIERRGDTCHALLSDLERTLARDRAFLADIHQMLMDDDMTRADIPLPPPPDHVSAKINIGGLEASVSKEFWHDHGAKIKIATLAGIGWALGWFSKLITVYFHK